MRIQVSLRLDEPLILPIHYNHIIQAVILRWLNEENYRRYVHDKGYEYNNRRYKLYTFSRLEGKFSIDADSKRIVFHDRVKLMVSALDDNFLQYVVNTVIMNDDIQILSNRVYVDEVTCFSDEIRNSGIFRTRSPIVVYSTFERDGSKKTYYYNPMEDEFGYLIRKNLINKHIAYYGCEPSNSDFEIKPVKNHRLKENIVMYKGVVIKGWSGDFEIKGSCDLMKIAYNAGLGSKNSQGFGFIDVVKDIPEGGR